MMRNRKVYWVADHMTSSLADGTQANGEAVVGYKSGIGLIQDKTIWPEDFYAGRIDWSSIACDSEYTRLENLMIHNIVMMASAFKGEYGVSMPTDERTGLVVSTTKGNVDLLASNQNDDRVLLDRLANRIAARLGMKCEPVVISNACISGVSALIVASRMIESGLYDNVVVVGGDLLTEFVVSGFQSFKSVTRKEKCTPYDESRDGLSMGEAAGAVLLSSDKAFRGEKPVVVLGGGITNDANHISGPSRTGDGLHYAMESAMRCAGVGADDISFVSAHGTATVYNDEMESKALNLSNLTAVPLNSVKPYFGHTLGACGVIESIMCVWQLRHGIVFGTAGFERNGVPFALNVSAEHRVANGKPCCLKIASGFGGCNAAMVLSLEDREEMICDIRGDVYAVNGVRMVSDEPFAGYIRNEYHALEAPNMKFFKMDDQCRMGYVAAEKLLKDFEAPLDKTRVAVILANRSSSLDTDLRHQRLLNSGEAASPAVFVYTLPNIVSGEICIRHGIQGENTFFVQEKSDGFARWYAEQLLHRSVADYVIFGWCDLLGEKYDGNFELLTIRKKN